MPDPRFWQERTRAVEDRLSDALHERLTQEFVDRPGTVIARHDPSELVTSVGGDGEVLVQGLRAGVLEGFRFRPDREVQRGLARRSSPPRTARSADLVRERVEALEREDDAAFALGPGAELLWRGARGGAARRRARAPLAPQVDVLAIGPPRPAAAGARAAPPRRAGSRRTCARRSRPLFALARDGAAPGAARGLAFALAEGLGAVSRRTVAQQVAALDAGRSARPRPARRHGRPPRRSSCPRCCAPEADAPAGAPLRRAPRAAPAATAPTARRPSPRRPAPARRLLPGLRLLPRRPARRPARPARARGRASPRASPATGPFVPPRELAPILGCRADELPAVLAAIGYVEQRRPLRAPTPLGGQVLNCDVTIQDLTPRIAFA